MQVPCTHRKVLSCVLRICVNLNDFSYGPGANLIGKAGNKFKLYIPFQAGLVTPDPAGNCASDIVYNDVQFSLQTDGQLVTTRCFISDLFIGVENIWR